jgi:hypothetical protein
MRPARALPLDSPIRKSRLCLKCSTTFQSEWAGERICPRCKGKQGWRSGGFGDNRTPGHAIKAKAGT